ncbi:uncharacterized protein LOC26514772 [Drosophila ananassae]|uniref:uncharacterized protein LOC26514772 n=1 Tax=Drosophila ananassae TaxID=7217 RepID=UPI001CFFC26F|nr:uncharacterized protein LOC26514772 [Drosophila ananassae]
MQTTNKNKQKQPTKQSATPLIKFPATRTSGPAVLMTNFAEVELSLDLKQNLCGKNSEVTESYPTAGRLLKWINTLLPQIHRPQSKEDLQKTIEICALKAFRTIFFECHRCISIFL